MAACFGRKHSDHCHVIYAFAKYMYSILLDFSLLVYLMDWRDGWQSAPPLETLCHSCITDIVTNSCPKHNLSKYIIFIVAPCFLKSILFTHQQMHYLLNLERFNIYTRIHTNIAPTCFGPRPSSGSLY
jgi:hypothetical protein